MATQAAEKQLAVSKPSIILPTLDGDRWDIIPGISLEMKNEKTLKGPIIEGRIGPVKKDDQIRIRIIKNGLPDQDLQFLGVVVMEGDNWDQMLEYNCIPEGCDNGKFETIVPIVEQNRMLVTKSSSNALKLITISNDGVYNEWTVAVVVKDDMALILQQHNFCEQIYSDNTGVPFLPRTRSKGKQPKRLAVVDLITREMHGFDLPTFDEPNYQPAPTGEGLTAGKARIVWWSAHRQVGGAVTHTGEQVRVFSGHLLGNRIFLEPGTVVSYQSMERATGATTYRHELRGVAQ
jgi:hypothetical protein